MTRRSIDLNADVGEGCVSDAALIPLVSSVNIACGAHAGDEETMRATLELAMRHGAAIGAHPGFEDRANFGRREMPVTPDDAAALVVGQTARLMALARERGATVGHIKLHGALYNMAARDPRLAGAIAAAIARRIVEGFPPVMYALAGGESVGAGRRAGLTVIGEAFADRTYRADGSLTPRSEPGALVANAGAAAAQALGIACEGTVRTADGSLVRLDAGTLCLHGDSAEAVESARAIRAALNQANIAVACGNF